MVACDIRSKILNACALRSSISFVCVCVSVGLGEKDGGKERPSEDPVEQMGTAAVLPRLFHDWIPNNKSTLNAKMNTCKHSNYSTEALAHFLVMINILSIGPASILHDC